MLAQVWHTACQLLSQETLPVPVDWHIACHDYHNLCDSVGILVVRFLSKQFWDTGIAHRIVSISALSNADKTSQTVFWYG